VSKNAERRRIDDDVVEHATDFIEYAFVAWTRKQFGDVITRAPTGEQVQTRRFETNNRVFKPELTAEHFRQSALCIDTEVIRGARAPQVAIDDECADAFSLSQQPGEIERRERFAFGDTRAADDNRAHLHALASLQNLRAQVAILLGVGRAR